MMTIRELDPPPILDSPPFISTFVNRVHHPIWLQCVCGVRDADLKHVLKVGAAFGKRRFHQTLNDWMEIPLCKSCNRPRTFMVGLLELLRDNVLPSGDSGECYLLHVDGRYGVWADTDGAARKFVDQAINEQNRLVK